eukprot:Protomagalhaensia_sp_Gyna_25__5791@NODE_84_length_5393_cov_96_575458_g65_i0_p2_GENE_NODE_84_length_5393_cov_96_575458_g65_i0NODE_84_length_5393_cov_96_575458_g65_i0_p2_ORF_typecomplete_len400_score76_92S1P1_nuclease/PF02265_16/3_1e27_NODE_84_length_5393_cov_96_575458_g65_i0301229
MLSCWTSLLSIPLVLFSGPVGVYGWDTDGHSAIGMTIMSGIKGPALTQLKRLLGGKDVVDVAGFGPSVVQKYPDLAPLFEMQQDLDPDKELSNCTRFDPDYPCPNKHCLVTATQHFYAKLAGTEEADIPGFELPVNLQLTDADNVKFLVALIGEMHNPVRYGYKFNDGGRNTPISFVDNGRTKESTLFDYWDYELTQKTIRDRPNFWFSGWTHLNSLGRGFYEEQQRLWKDANHTGRAKLFKSWAEESFKSSCSRVQRKFNQPLDNANVERDLLVPDKHSYTPSGMFLDFEYVKAKLLTAGIRASIVLNSILDSRDAKKLRVGSGIQVQMDQNHALNPLAASKSQRTSIAQWSTNFGINFLIIITVLTAFGVFIRFSSGSGGSRPRSPAAVRPKEKVHD